MEYKIGPILMGMLVKEVVFATIKIKRLIL